MFTRPMRNDVLKVLLECSDSSAVLLELDDVFGNILNVFHMCEKSGVNGINYYLDSNNVVAEEDIAFETFLTAILDGSNSSIISLLVDDIIAVTESGIKQMLIYVYGVGAVLIKEGCTEKEIKAVLKSCIPTSCNRKFKNI